MQDYTKTAKAVLLDLINTSNPGLNLLDAEATFSAPTAGAGKVTTITITMVEGRRFKASSKTLTYNRLDLAEVLATDDAEFVKTDLITSIADVVSLVNARFGINLQPSDYDADDFPTFTDEPGESFEITLTASPGSLVYVGEMVVTLSVEKQTADEAITNDDLDGLTYVGQ